MTRASNAGHPDLADRVFHVRALRALGISPPCFSSLPPKYYAKFIVDFAAFVLLEELKERLRQASVNTSMLETLALLNGHDHEEVVRPSQDVMPMPNGIKKKRKQMQDGYLLLAASAAACFPCYCNTCLDDSNLCFDHWTGL